MERRRVGWGGGWGRYPPPPSPLPPPERHQVTYGQYCKVKPEGVKQVEEQERAQGDELCSEVRCGGKAKPRGMK